ncbi:DUF6933 domain-containing protein [Echinicola jeungdonensis]
MANIYCTKKLEKLIGKKNMAANPSENLLGNWNANIFTFKQRKCLILVNEETYYSVLFLDVLKADILNFHHLFYERLIEQLTYDHIHFPHEYSPKILNDLQPIFLPTNNNRRILGVMNQFISDTVFHIDYFFEGKLADVDVSFINNKLTTDLVKALMVKGEGDTWTNGQPITAMKTKISECCHP